MVKKKKEIYNQKEKNMFWVALMVGIVGGLLGNLLVSYVFDLKQGFSWTSLVGALSFSAMFIFLLIYMRRQIKPVK